MKVAVVGAGPAGLTAAYQISKEDPDVVVYEADEYVGGLSRSIKLWDQTVDLGPHRFFSKDHRVNELWLEVAGKDFLMVDRQTRILYKGQLFQYPLEAFDALVKLGPLEAVKCFASYIKELVAPSLRDDSFEAWVRTRFGKRLFELFFKTYSEKLWGIPCSQLDADFAAQRIRTFSLPVALKSALFPWLHNKYRTLVDRFAYPTEGSGMIYERMAVSIISRGGEVHLSQPIRKILTQDGHVVGLELISGRKVLCDHVISTMPLTTMVRSLDGVPPDVLIACSQLKFRNTIVVYLEILNKNPFSDHWIYVHSPDILFGRVSNFRNWAPSICGKSPHTIIALEFWCNSDDELWKRNDEDMIALAKNEILKSGLIGCRPELLDRGYVFRIPKCYPVYQRNYQKHVKLIQTFLDTIVGLSVIGRYGAFKYNNQDHSILMGRFAAENILYGAKHNLWAVNTDYETYQEDSDIAEVGSGKSPGNGGQN